MFIQLLTSNHVMVAMGNSKHIKQSKYIKHGTSLEIMINYDLAHSCFVILNQKNVAFL